MIGLEGVWSSGARVGGQVLPVTLGSVESTGIARGFAAVDAMVKKASVDLLDARAVCPGKFFILIAGDVAAVEESVIQGRDTMGDELTGSFIIPNLHPEVLPAVRKSQLGLWFGSAGGEELSGASDAFPEALGVVETFSAASAVFGADASRKSADVGLKGIFLLNGLGGKAYYCLSGTVTDVETAVEAGCDAVESRDIAGRVIIPRVDREVISFFQRGKG